MEARGVGRPAASEPAGARDRGDLQLVEQRLELTSVCSAR